ncbi:MAG TPA: helix-turn-helix transcriptional regulator [Solirubrobacteraceae bacterium]|nr:helix-turn-helix transcriptional regulator [Solirubrobacteraceae bacterium]
MRGSGGDSSTPSRRQNTPMTSVEVDTERAVKTTTAARRRGRTVTRVELESDRGVFMISVAAELANLHPQTLRVYEARGLIEPQRSSKGTRLYSQEDVEKLKRIQEMTAELGLNLAGVERVLHLEQEIEDMQRRIEETELDALEAQLRLSEELEEVRRSFRAELVPYRGSRELVRVADLMKSFQRPTNFKRHRKGSSDGT